jgi:tRNA (Thr-GGU) A37 N-methylase
MYVKIEHKIGGYVVMEDNKIETIKPVGEVISEWEEPVRIIRVMPEYLAAMRAMEENEYFWIFWHPVTRQA